ncbi:MAG: hypothetical protein ACPGID_11905 [Rubricella sp.]
MSPEAVAALFTRSDGSYAFARWGRPIVPVVFGVDDGTVSVFKGAVEALVLTAGHRMAEMDPELGVNLATFFVRDWAELTATPDLDRLVPDLAPLVARLEAAEANQYRLFRFDAEGAIRAAFVFIRYDEHLAAVSAETLALSQMVQTMLLWSDTAFMDQAPLMRVEGGEPMLRPEIGSLLRAAYDPVMPDVADDASHALRLAARMGGTQ